MDEMEHFDEMERNFHKIVQELVADRSLDRFRQEYEKLHAALVESHEMNAQLIEKCRSLNNDILANANKVSSVMQLSQNDQRTIAGLRYEFEKAWKLVEVTQEKENKSKDVIDNLKGEVANLSRLVEQGGTMTFTQQFSLDDMTNSIATMKKEIALQEQQLKQMSANVSNARQEHEEMKQTLENLKVTNIQLAEELEKERGVNSQVANDAIGIHKEIQDIKTKYTEMQTQIESNTKAIADKKERISDLQSLLGEEQRTVKSGQEDVKINLQNVHLKQKLCEDRAAMNQKTLDDINARHRKFEQKENQMKELQAQMDEVNAELDMVKEEYATAKSYKEALWNEKREGRKKLNDCRTQARNLTVEQAGKDLSLAGSRREMERMKAEQHDLNGQYVSERAETKIVEGQRHIVTNEIIGVKFVSHNERATIDRLDREIEDYTQKGATAKSDFHQAKLDLQSKEDQLSKGGVQLSKLSKRIKRQDLLLETVKTERDMECRQLEQAKKDNDELLGDNKALGITIRGLKEEIRENDTLCIETHMKRQVIQAELVELAKKVKEWQRKLKETEEVCTEYRNRIQRAVYLVSQSEMDIKKQKQVLSDLEYKGIAMTASVTKRSAEVDLLREKADTVTGLLRLGSAAFRKQVEKVNALKEELLAEVERQKGLMAQGQHRRALQLEEIRIQKQLVVEAGKCRALEDELEKPMNIHRWRFYEGTNTEMAQMIRMTMELRDRLMLKIQQFERLRGTHGKWQEKAKTAEGHLKRGYAGDIREEFAFLNAVLKQKTRQLAQIEERVVGQSETVSTQKEQLMTMRTMVREEKAEYFDTKQRVQDIRCSTAKPRTRESKPQFGRPESRFVGGGFAVGGVIKDEGSKPYPKSPAARRDIKSALAAAPHIVQPKSASVVARRMPRGWNPQRGPLKPLLPTATGSP